VVIIAEHQSYALKLWVAHKTLSVLVAIKIRFNFLVEGKHTRNLFQVRIYIFTDKAVPSVEERRRLRWMVSANRNTDDKEAEQ
jgi:hypothetical protein